MIVEVRVRDAAFYIRNLNTTTPLNTKQANDYISIIGLQEKDCCKYEADKKATKEMNPSGVLTY
jgi:hypothetical protein